MAKNVIQNLIDSGLALTEVQRQQAEKLVKDLVKSGEVRRKEAEKTVQALIERGKETSAMMSEVVKGEVTKQLGWLANRVDDLEDQLEGLVTRMSNAGPSPAKKTAAKKAPDTSTTAKKAPAKKTAAKKTAATKTAAKKAAAKKSAAAPSTDAAS